MNQPSTLQVVTAAFVAYLMATQGLSRNQALDLVAELCVATEDYIKNNDALEQARRG
jgi:hypothetical protein